MACGAESTSSVKRAKLCTEKKRDALERERNELILGVANARAKAEELVREAEEAGEKIVREARQSLAQQLPSVCADLEAENRDELMGKLPPELWEKIVDENVQQNDLVALAMTCRFFREKQKDLGKKVVTNLNHLRELWKSGKVASHSLGWFQWVCDTFEILPGYMPGINRVRVKGALYKSDLLDYAAFQGSVEILRWLVEEKGWELNRDTGWWGGVGGSIEVLDFLREMGYEFDWTACSGAARAGRLEALKYLRGLDPPCPWSTSTCTYAAQGGHLEVLKWLRAQDPPCPWDEETCAWAASEGRLEVLKWARSQDPPCPWSAVTCSEAVKGGHLEVLKWARSQDPPCRLDELTCTWAAEKGQLEVFKWARSQDPPCPWDGETCACAAGKGHLDVLKFARGQDPPCPWSRDECRRRASMYGRQHIIDWIDQQEDESDVDY